MEERYKLEKEARNDIKDSFKFYEEKQQGLGEKFLEKVDQKIEEVCEKPDRYSTFYKDIRKAPLDKFPFNLVYRLRDKIVSILAVWHKSRNPENLNSRIEK